MAEADQTAKFAISLPEEVKPGSLSCEVHVRRTKPLQGTRHTGLQGCPEVSPFFRGPPIEGWSGLARLGKLPEELFRVTKKGWYCISEDS